MRRQVTVYLAADRKAWLKRYAQQQGFKESELIHWLIERERNVRWLERSLRASENEASEGRRTVSRPAKRQRRA